MTTGTALDTVTRPAPKSIATMQQGGSVLAIVPQTMDEVWRFSQVLAASGLCPYGMDTPEKVSVAILTGLELGVKPMQAVQGIAVIGGRPCIWGDLSLGLVRSNPEFEWISETYDGEEPEDWTTTKPAGAELKFKAVCVVKRKGQPEVRREFTIGDAVVAKLWGKRGRQGQDTPWITGPKRMLQMRARAFALRDLFTDVLKGLYIAEELIGTAVDHDSVNYNGASNAQIAGPQAPDDAEEITAETVQAAHASAPRREAPPAVVTPAATVLTPEASQAKVEEVKATVHAPGPEESGDHTDGDLADFDPENWVLEARVLFNDATTEKRVDEIHTMFEDTAQTLRQDLRIQYEDAHQEALARFASGMPAANEQPAGPDGPDDDDGGFPGQSAIDQLRTGQSTMTHDFQADEEGEEGEGEDDEEEDTAEAKAFKADMQAILTGDWPSHDALKAAFDARTADLQALLADGDITAEYDAEFRAALRTRYYELRDAATKKAGTGDAAADAMTERLRTGLATCEHIQCVNDLATDTLVERNAFGSKHPEYANWKAMIVARRKELSAIG